MWQFFGLVALQSLLLSVGQVFLKLAMEKMDKFAWTWTYFKSVLNNLWFLACGISFGAATVLWLYILKKYPFSQAYPLTSLSFIFGMIAAWLVFGESIPFSRWIGLILVVFGCFLIMK